jgi:hypothetical protein
MKRRFLTIVAPLVLAVGACGIIVPMPGSANLYPLQGPIAEQKAAASIPIGVWATAFNSDLSLSFPGGETFSGRIEPVSKAEGATDMAADWDAVFGPGYYTARVLGARGYYRGVIKGSRGTILRVECIGSPTIGVAHDSNGNLFKLT